MGHQSITGQRRHEHWHLISKKPDKFLFDLWEQIRGHGEDLVITTCNLHRERPEDQTWKLFGAALKPGPTIMVPYLTFSSHMTSGTCCQGASLQQQIRHKPGGHSPVRGRDWVFEETLDSVWWTLNTRLIISDADISSSFTVGGALLPPSLVPFLHCHSICEDDSLFANVTVHCIVNRRLTGGDNVYFF